MLNDLAACFMAARFFWKQRQHSTMGASPQIGRSGLIGIAHLEELK
jgi:hypothetical protein